jgi:hypothetical protein
MILGFLTCVLVMFFLQMFTPFWWWIMVIPFVYGFVATSSLKDSFSSGALSAGLVWFSASLFYFLTSSNIIAQRMAIMFHLGFGLVLVIITALIAAIAGGCAAALGYSLGPGLLFCRFDKIQ